MLRRRVGCGTMIPRGYGLAWYEPCSDYSICYPLGLNWIFGGVRAFWLILLLPLWARGLRKREHELYQRQENIDREDPR